jgi:hypothetical protein
MGLKHQFNGKTPQSQVQQLFPFKKVSGNEK